MAGNTRGKLKEHFEGIHKNLDWCLHHINTSLKLIAVQMFQIEGKDLSVATTEEIDEIAGKHLLYKGIKALGEGITVLDSVTQGIYSNL